MFDLQFMYKSMKREYEEKTRFFGQYLVFWLRKKYLTIIFPPEKK